MVYLLFFLSQSYVLGRMVGWGYVQPGTNGWSISSKVGDAMRPEATETGWLFQGVWKMSWTYWTLPFLRNPCWTISNFVWWFLSSIPNERGWTWYMFERKHTFSQDSPTTNSQKTVFFTFHRAKAELTLWAVKLRGQVTLVYPPIIIIDDLYSYGPKYQSS